MIDYEEVVEAIWRYDIPRIDIDEDVTTLYADGKAFAQVIRRPDGSREDLYFEDYELQKDTLIKPNACLVLQPVCRELPLRVYPGGHFLIGIIVYRT